jgi:hypothetical protein
LLLWAVEALEFCGSAAGELASCGAGPDSGCWRPAEKAGEAARSNANKIRFKVSLPYQWDPLSAH